MLVDNKNEEQVHLIRIIEASKERGSISECRKDIARSVSYDGCKILNVLDAFDKCLTLKVADAVNGDFSCSGFDSVMFKKRLESLIQIGGLDSSEFDCIMMDIAELQSKIYTEINQKIDVDVKKTAEVLFGDQFDFPYELLHPEIKKWIVHCVAAVSVLPSMDSATWESVKATAAFTSINVFTAQMAAAFGFRASSSRKIYENLKKIYS